MVALADSFELFLKHLQGDARFGSILSTLPCSIYWKYSDVQSHEKKSTNELLTTEKKTQWKQNKI